MERDRLNVYFERANPCDYVWLGKGNTMNKYDLHHPAHNPLYNDNLSFLEFGFCHNQTLKKKKKKNTE